MLFILSQGWGAGQFFSGLGSNFLAPKIPGSDRLRLPSPGFTSRLWCRMKIKNKEFHLKLAYQYKVGFTRIYHLPTHRKLTINIIYISIFPQICDISFVENPYSKVVLSWTLWNKLLGKFSSWWNIMNQISFWDRFLAK